MILYEVIRMRPLKQKVSITLDADVIEQVKALSEDNDRSFSQYINLVLKNHISRVKAKDKADK